MATLQVQDRARALPLPLAQVPRHVAIIMDGNGRWARERGLPRLAGHRAGTENLRRVIQRFADYGVRYLTLFAFSTENWQRPKREVQGLMRILGQVIRREVQHLHENGVRLLHIGSLEGLPPRLQRQVQEAIELTKENDRLTLVIAFNYGGRAEILEAIRQLLAKGIPPDDLSEELFAEHLYTADIPDPDLIIRTGGEMRISNFLLWQAAYAEFYSTSVYWPDFSEEDIDAALLAYSRRKRRFGRLPQDESDYPQPPKDGRRRPR
ncbi:Ditrans,polycis-undecaprenyl-diphosphate synthase ((2E,6E)-farnesyl-diphosphate specific) [bacterium HR25]|jgi:undecaprenyl diphosphate synthase|nr:Ditrans,polycis-undecaprenyl-diphosphate synthase ((2E,6E)-farnesyl-diphosphate specific) [bacterium HR25]